MRSKLATPQLLRPAWPPLPLVAADPLGGDLFHFALELVFARSRRVGVVARYRVSGCWFTQVPQDNSVSRCDSSTRAEISSRRAMSSGTRTTSAPSPSASPARSPRERTRSRGVESVTTATWSAVTSPSRWSRRGRPLLGVVASRRERRRAPDRATEARNRGGRSRISGRSHTPRWDTDSMLHIGDRSRIGARPGHGATRRRRVRALLHGDRPGLGATSARRS